MTRREHRSGDVQRVAPLAALGFAWATLLAALVVCAGPQAIGAQAGRPHTALGPVAQRHADAAAEADAAHVCSPPGGGGGGHGRSGCNGSSGQRADGLLPGPPPQAAQPVPAWAPLRPVLTASGPSGPLPGSDLAPDLYRLQVLRT